jgi:hypothetical protein
VRYLGPAVSISSDKPSVTVPSVTLLSLWPDAVHRTPRATLAGLLDPI